jgi:ADP-ribosylation factor GTPase-activating protein 1
LGKGWSLFSSAVIGATKVVNENVIQPSVEKVSDPNFRNGIVQSVNNTAKSANDWSKTQLGVDVGELLGNTSSSSSRGRYAALDAHDANQYEVDRDTGLYADAGNDELSSVNLNEPPARDTWLFSTVTQSSKSAPAIATNKDEWQDDEWNDF